MTFEECSKFRNEIAARVTKIETRWDEETTFDSPAFRELRSYCERIRPLFAGRYGNVGGKTSAMAAAAAKKVIDDGYLVSSLKRALAGINIAVIMHELATDS